MKIAVINEGSTKNRNADVVRALDGMGHEIFNLGMKNIEGEPDLTYMETALLSALALNLGVVDFVIGGCGTGQGYMNAVLQYPGVACGLITDPVEAYLFSQVNAGNCISLQLNKGYGNLAGDINVRYSLERLFNDTYGQGYPAARGAIQRAAREKLQALSGICHYPMADILRRMDRETAVRALRFPGIRELFETAKPSDLKTAIKEIG